MAYYSNEYSFSGRKLLLDVYMKAVIACVMITLANGKVDTSIRTFATTMAALLALAEWLASLLVSHVAM